MSEKQYRTLMLPQQGKKEMIILILSEELQYF